MKLYFRLLWVNLATRYSLLAVIIGTFILYNIDPVIPQGRFAAHQDHFSDNLKMITEIVMSIAIFIFLLTELGYSSVKFYRAIVKHGSNKEIVERMNKMQWAKNLYPCYKAAVKVACHDLSK